MQIIVPLLSLVVGETAYVWKALGLRIAATLIGVLLYSVVSLVIFPVTTVDHVRDETAAALKQTIRMTDLITDLLTAADKDLSQEYMDKAAVEFDKIYVSNKKTMLRLINKRNLLEKDVVARWVILKLLRCCNAIWCCGESILPHGPGKQYRAFSFEKLEQLIFYLRYSVVSMSIAVLVQKRCLSRGAWENEGRWTNPMKSIGAQAAECLKALRLVLLNVASMEE